MSLNLVVVRGVCAQPPELRIVASGARLVTLALRVPDRHLPTTSVPVAVWDPPPWLEDVEAGEPLAVVGRVRRRFFRGAAGAPIARVEVEAHALARGADRRRLTALARRAARAVEQLTEDADGC